jgi:PncC family amidohydrolase
VADTALLVHEMLLARGATLATAESLTGGRLAARITNVPGSSGTFLGGIVSYATELKEELLGVPEAIVYEHGVVSAECAEAMTWGILAATGATYGLATTGVAGPTEQEGKAVGTVFVGVGGPAGVRSVPLRLDGGRGEIQDAACEEALAELLSQLQRESGGLG